MVMKLASSVPLHTTDLYLFNPMTKPNKNDKITSAAISIGVIGAAAMFGAIPAGIAAGCTYLGIKLLEDREDPNTISTTYIEAPHRKKQPKSNSTSSVIPPNVRF